MFKAFAEFVGAQSTDTLIEHGNSSWEGCAVGKFAGHLGVDNVNCVIAQ